ncbi:hypothetical protein D3C85_1338910 [compost metagenome]
MRLQRVLLPSTPAVIRFSTVKDTFIQQSAKGIQHGVAGGQVEACFSQFFTGLRDQLTCPAIQRLTVLNLLAAAQLTDHQPAGIKNLLCLRYCGWFHVRSTAKSSSFTSPSEAGV